MFDIEGPPDPWTAATTLAVELRAAIRERDTVISAIRDSYATFVRAERAAIGIYEYAMRREADRARYHERVAIRACTECSADPQPNQTRCRPCAQKKSASVRRSQRKAAIAATPLASDTATTKGTNT